MSTATSINDENISDLTSIAHSSGSSCDERIAEKAYYIAEKRGFESGHELDDWLSAEQEYHMIHHA